MVTPRQQTPNLTPQSTSFSTIPLAFQQTKMFEVKLIFHIILCSHCSCSDHWAQRPSESTVVRTEKLLLYVLPHWPVRPFIFIYYYFLFDLGYTENRHNRSEVNHIIVVWSVSLTLALLAPAVGPCHMIWVRPSIKVLSYIFFKTMAYSPFTTVTATVTAIVLSEWLTVPMKRPTALVSMLLFSLVLCSVLWCWGYQPKWQQNKKAQIMTSW